MTDTMRASAVGNLLLRWVSELGAGRLRDLRAGVRRTARGLGQGAESRWVRDLAALGHLDVDWRRDRWSAAPSVLSRLPHSDGLAMIAGRRTAAFERTLTESGAGARVLRVANPGASGDVPAPDTLLLRYEDPSRLPDYARRLGCVFVPCALPSAAAALSTIEEGPPAAPPPADNAFTVERFDLATRRYQPTDLRGSDGLYRWRGADWNRLTQVRRGGSWLQVEHEVGVYLELARHATTVLRWDAEPGVGRSQVGFLAVERGAPLPPLHARIATLCGGLRPRVDPATHAIVYDNVPRPIAERIALSLRQCLTVDATPPTGSTDHAPDNPSAAMAGMGAPRRDRH
jgi:hypothetical protein